MPKARRLLHVKDYLPNGLLREIRIYEVPVSGTFDVQEVLEGKL